MFVDINGKSRAKIGVHIHTSASDGLKSIEECARLYYEAGYDAIVVSDHWKYTDECEIEGIKIISGCEYDVGGGDSRNGVFHIVGMGMTGDPEIPSDWRNMVKTSVPKAKQICDKIRLHNGLAILAHPHWSLNTTDQLLRIGNFDAVEIYNAVSECGMSDRAYSEHIIDCLANEEFFPLIFACDDCHYYEDDLCRTSLMVEAKDLDTQGLIRAIKAGRYYTTQGPELQIEQPTPDSIKVKCSPASSIAFMSNSPWTPGRMVRGDGIVEASYVKTPADAFVRVVVKDKDGRMAWSNFILF